MSLLNTPLHELDPAVAAAVDAELHRQQSTLEMTGRVTAAFTS